MTNCDRIRANTNPEVNEKIDEALREPKRVDPNHDLVLTARETGISFGD